MIRLRTLGTVELVDSEGAESRQVLAQPKRLALLAYLAVATPRGFQRRDTILGIFWPELDQDRARGALGQAVHFLRRALGQQALVNRGGQELGLNRDLVWCDAVAFDDALDTGHADKAVELYRGDLLSGFFIEDAPEFETWLERERARLRRRALEAAGSRAEALERDGDPVAASRVLRRALTLAPEDERVLRRLMRVLDATGDRAGAITAYEQFARRLQRELDVKPAPETRALLDRIKERDEPLATVGGAAGDADPPAETDEGAVAAEPAAASRSEERRPAPAQRPSGAWRYVLGVLAGITLAAVAAAVWLRPSVSPDSSARAIMISPFVPGSADTALRRLGRDLVITVSSSLDGVGELRTVDALTVLARVESEQAPLSLARALELGRSLGAGRVLHGALVRVGEQVRVDAALHAIRGGEPLARASAVAAADDVISLSDSLTWALLRQMWPVGAPAGLSPAALSTRSLPALRAFLEGERAIAESRWRVAPDHFARAIELDSTFWFAYWRYARAMDYRSRPVDPSIRTAYLAHLAKFPERDRMYIEATRADSLSERLARARRLVERYPTYSMGWFEYADQLVHNAPFLGATAADARAALERTAELNPGDPTVWQHVFWLTVAAVDTVASGYALQRLDDLGHGAASRAEVGIDQVQFFRYLNDLAVRGEAAFDTALADSLASALVGYSGPIDHDAFTGSVSLYGFHRGEIFLSERTLRLPVPPGIAASMRRSIAMAWAGRGAWDSAMAALDRYVESTPGFAPILHAYRLATVGVWLGALPEGTGQRWRAMLEAQIERLPPASVSELAWLGGLRAAAAGDLEALSGAIERLGSAGPPGGPFLRRSLEAFRLALAGDVANAAATMAELERERTEHYWFRRIANRHPYLTAVDRLAASSWLQAAADTARAAQLLTWHEAVQFPSLLAGQADATLSANIYYERARLAEAMGLSELARAHYRQFLRRYDSPVAAHRAMVEQARAALERSAETRRITF